jgi:pimeloyl-ACP methyl ester carboxylesterase
MTGQQPIDFVFLHGGQQGGWVWSEVIAALQSRGGGRVGRLMTLDVPGCGAKRDRPARRLSVPQVIDDLLADVDAAGLSGAVLVGHSQAGTLIPSLLAARPQAFARAVYVSCCAPEPGQTVIDMMGEGLRGEDPSVVGWPVRRETADMATFAQAMFCNDMDEAQMAAFLSQLGEDAWPEACSFEHRDWTYGAARQPATYVLLERDESLPLEWQQRFAERLGASRRPRIDAGHQVMQIQPGRLAEVLLDEAG